MRPTKAEMIKLFPEFSPRRAFREFNPTQGEMESGLDGWEVAGKYVRAARMLAEEDDPEVWDVFVCNTANMTVGLGQKRVNRMAGLFPKNAIDSQVLDGEAWFQADFETTKRWLEENRKWLGIRKRQPTRTVGNPFLRRDSATSTRESSAK